MRTRNTVKVSGGNGNNTQKRKYTRQPRNKSHTTANRNSGLDDFQPEQDQWNYIRMKLPKERPVRRLSHAFLHHERINLERRREKLRFLMEDSMFEYLDDDIPSAIPKPIDIGSTVRGTTFIPHYGSHTGQVIGVENRNIPLFRVRFRNDSEQLIPDYRVALEQFFHIAEALDTVSVTSKHLKQIALQEINLIEKFRLLHALENIRLNLAARHATGFLNAVQDKEQIEAYDQTVRKLMHLNRNLLQLMKQISTDYEQYMAEPLTANDEDDVPVVDKYVMDEANQLLAAYTKLDQIDNSPVADLLWRETMQRLHRRPEYLQQFEAYLASNIGMIFDVTSRSLR
ncbi:uncharacterized protein LOC125768375 isoform X2 [Anopheles funestus]|uniref:uncharacterized protein LOC125768375 isoform X2 n=1 Tax=Anopheles funestus TaxID=62324 RepID=UPI0020C62589|nr:uncharacterized protein LOC125768375 isoform X2 [Anopheles funestus]